MSKRDPGKPRKQVAALPVTMDANGALRILVITSRETKRFIVPKGWPMKGMKDHKAAEIEAREEAGVRGNARSKPIGSYLTWKRGKTSFQLVRVRVFLLDVERETRVWLEKGQREMAWLSAEDAVTLVDEPGLAQIILDLPARLPKNWRSRATLMTPVSGPMEPHASGPGAILPHRGHR